MNFQNLQHYVLPKDVNIQIPVSGGRSSAYQLAHIIEANNGLPDNCVCTFQNTGFEMDATLDFLKSLEDHFSIKIVRLERDMSEPHKVRIVGHNSLDRNGGPMKDLFSEIVPKRRDGTAGVRPLANPAQRVCTTNLKIKTADRYLTKILGWSRPYYAALGYRADEPKRVVRRKKSDEKNQKAEGGVALFLMFNAGVTSGDVLSFWRAMPFDLGISSEEGNCDFCFMKSTTKIKHLMLMYPERVAPWIAFEERISDRPGAFRRDRPSLRVLFEQVKAGDMSAPRDDKECGTCGA